MAEPPHWTRATQWIATRFGGRGLLASHRVERFGESHPQDSEESVLSRWLPIRFRGGGVSYREPKKILIGK